MALFDTFSRANKRQDGDLDVRYLSDVVKMTANGPVYHVTRIASKSYEYFGMTKAAANECKREKQAQYYRKFAAYQYENGKITPRFSFGCTAEVDVSQIAGDDYACKISVSESDTIYTMDAADTVEACRKLFAFAELRNYDEDNPAVVGIAIATANFDNVNQRLRLTYTTNIEDFAADSSHVFAEYFNKATGDWARASGEITFETGAIIIQTTEKPLWRMVYEPGAQEPSIVSNEVTPVIDQTETKIHLTSCTLDILFERVAFEFTNTLGYANPQNMITPQWYDEENDAWVDVTGQDVTIRGAVYMETRLVSGNNLTWRLKFQNSSIVYYSNAMVSEGDTADSFRISISEARTWRNANGETISEVDFTTSIPGASLIGPSTIINAAIAHGQDTPVESVPVSIVRVGAVADETFRATFKSGQGGATFGLTGYTFQLFVGHLKYGAHAIESNIVTPVCLFLITSAANYITQTKIKIGYEQNIQGFDTSKIKMQIKMYGSETWGSVSTTLEGDYIVYEYPPGLQTPDVRLKYSPSQDESQAILTNEVLPSQEN